VPAFMIHTPPCLGLSGSPSVWVVAFGTAIVMWMGPDKDRARPPPTWQLEAAKFG